MEERVKVLQDVIKKIEELDQNHWPPTDEFTRRRKERWGEREPSIQRPGLGENSVKVVNSNIFITEPSKVLDMFRAYYRGVDGREIVSVMSFNSEMEFIGWGPVAWGTVDHVVVHPAEVFTEVLKNHAKYFIVCHNHPSNNVTPSKDDMIMLESLRQIGLLLDRPMKDFLIIANDTDAYYSQRDHLYDL